MLDVILVESDRCAGFTVTYFADIYPCFISFFAGSSFAKEHNVGCDFCERIALEGIVRQSNRAQKVRPVGDIRTCSGVVGIQEVAANHLGHDASLTKLIQRFGQEVVMNREAADVTVVGVIERLTAKRRVTNDCIKVTGGDHHILQALVDIGRLRVELFANLGGERI
ncbi:hypothetical protein D3C77_401070 [compost metagenome]